MILGKRRDDGTWQELAPFTEFDFHSTAMVSAEGAWQTLLIVNPDGSIEEFKAKIICTWEKAT
jgi:hypothetical protein